MAKKSKKRAKQAKRRAERRTERTPNAPEPSLGARLLGRIRREARDRHESELRREQTLEEAQLRHAQLARARGEEG